MDVGFSPTKPAEIFRYLFFVMPMMRSTLVEIENVAPMNLPVFLLWGIWDTILVLAITFFSWLYLDRFGFNKINSIIAGTYFWLAVFIILWLGLLNMNLATLNIPVSYTHLTLPTIYSV